MAQASLLEQNKSWLRKASSSFFEGFGSALRTVGFLSFIGGVGGFFLIYIRERLEWFGVHPGWSLLFEHVGMGFIVSSIAVFGYEWRSHSRETIDLSKKLVDLLKTQGSDALRRGLSDMFSPKGVEHEVARHIGNVATSLSELLRKGREAHYYVSFFSGIISGLIESNIQEIKGFYEKTNAEVTFRVLSTGLIVSDILAAQMNSMEEDETYEVVSDLYSWKDDQLKSFQDATRKAVGVGVEVIRIFNLWATDEIEYREMPAKVVKAILQEHLKADREWGIGYKVFYFGKEELKNLKAEYEGIDERSINSMHKGIFSRNGEPVISFEVVDRSLARIRLNQHKGDLHDAKIMFSKIRSFAEPLTDDILEKAVEEYTARRNEVRGAGGH
jgi:hypothetical protein